MLRGALGGGKGGVTARSVWKSSLWLPQGAKREGGDWRLGGQGGGRGGGAEVQVGSCVCVCGGNEEGRVEGSRVWLVRDEQVWRKGPGLRLWVSQGVTRPWSWSGGLGWSHMGEVGL